MVSYVIQNNPVTFQTEDTHTFTNVDGTASAFGSELKIKENRLTIGCLEMYLTRDSGHIGGSFWLSSIAMLLYIRSNMHEFENKRVIELGAGTALPSMYLSKTCCDIVIASDADLAPTITSLRHNPCAVIPVKLEWSGDSHGLFDIIIACDCVYRGDNVAFTNAVLSHLAPGGTLYMINAPNREGFDECLYQLEEALTCRNTEFDMTIGHHVAKLSLVKAHKDSPALKQLRSQQGRDLHLNKPASMSPLDRSSHSQV